ncbi:hypothetical protein Ahy_A09g043461 isoform A [Arachis hypogaea]|uniref:Uncharacterized protein n=1 Tax=Arachis hypogaea TaxID=3818 RepID=A0A445BIH5_ARAHY|nr:hypothetical protein Ahy_A09g043461 isoform A [Arachis hypogaea]
MKCDACIYQTIDSRGFISELATSPCFTPVPDPGGGSPPAWQPHLNAHVLPSVSADQLSLLHSRTQAPFFSRIWLNSCCHSRLPASIFSVGVMIPILPLPRCDLSFCPFSPFLSARCWCHSEILDLQPSFLYPHPVRVSGSFPGLSQFSLSGYIVHQGYRLPSRFSVPNDPSEQYCSLGSSPDDNSSNGIKLDEMEYGSSGLLMAIHYRADPYTDEVFAQIALLPEQSQDENAVEKEPPLAPR